MNLDILKMLMSFLTAKREQPPNQDGQKSERNPQDLLSALSNFLSNTKALSKKKPQEKPEVSSLTTLTSDYLQAPLQTSMLETMSSHDSFIKKVKEKNQKT